MLHAASMDPGPKTVDASKLRTFKKGVHPTDYKAFTNTGKIEYLPLSDDVFIPLKQHIGEPGKPLISPGDEVKTALRKLFAKEITVLLGDQDTDPGPSSLRRTPEAMQQGAHRFPRDHTFYEACWRMAQALNVQFAWDLRVVPGVAHSNAGMVPAAANALFDKTN